MKDVGNILQQMQDALGDPINKAEMERKLMLFFKKKEQDLNKKFNGSSNDTIPKINKIIIEDGRIKGIE